MQSIYDAIVVGAGPAGSSSAYELAFSGLTVLLVDKAVFPRQKCCGGGVTVKASKFLGDVLQEAGEKTISNATFKSGRSTFLGRADGTVITTVSRQRLDHHMLLRAEKAGAYVLQGTGASALTPHADSVDVNTTGGTYRGRFIIGADGARGVVARSIGVRHQSGFAGIETEVAVDPQEARDWESTILVDLGWTAKGYAWLFPKKDHFSLGIGCLVGTAAGLKQKYWRFLNSLDLKNYRITDWSAGFIPMYTQRPTVTAGRIAIVGDAAGLADPLTGEGIGNAVLSAHMASEAVKDAIAHGHNDLSAYQKAVERDIVPDIEAARFLSRIIFRLPGRMLDIARLDGRLWQAGCSLVRGQTRYSSIKGRVGSIPGLYSLLRGKALGS